MENKIDYDYETMEKIVEIYFMNPKNSGIRLDKLMEKLEESLNKYNGTHGNYFLIRVYRNYDVFYDVKHGIFFNKVKPAIITTIKDFYYMFPLGSKRNFRRIWNMFIKELGYWIMANWKSFIGTIQKWQTNGIKKK